MSCIEIQDLLVQYLLDELDAPSRASIELHLANNCRECKAELQVLTESVDMLWQAVPARKLSEDLQRSIVERARALERTGQLAGQSSGASRPASSQGQRFRSSIVQALLAFAAGLLFMMYVQPSLNDAAMLADHSAKEPAEATVNLASLRFPATLEMSEKKYESTHFVSLRRSTGSDELRGHVLWDSLTREIHIFCFGLQQPPPRSQYSLWLIGPGIEVRVAERLEVDSEGICKATAGWPEGDFRYVKVTLEASSKLNTTASSDVQLTSNAIQPWSP